MTSKLLITGATGQLGTELVAALERSGRQVVGLDLPEFDLTKPDAAQALIKSHEPRIVLHAAGYTHVDKAESESELVHRVNMEGTRAVAQACHDIGARMIYYSTDYVFDGTKGTAYTEDDKPNPLGVYGRSKLGGEEAIGEALEDHLIIRTAWLYGPRGKNFVRAMLRLAQQQVNAHAQGLLVEPIKVVDDQLGNPTSTTDLVRQTLRVMEEPITGIVHATCHGETTWYEWACRMFDKQNLAVLVRPCTTEQFGRPAPRPKCSSLDNARLLSEGLDVMRNWDVALDNFLTGRHQAD
ncbi:dTDP-4-dehydrorhamnose reductase [candidate division GN15 bacterium]|nr:dTDP-4-dehydrorhamnose reductase [candidate division GN15 bacterium]